MIFTSDFVTRENHCRIASLVTKIVIHGNSCVILYVLWYWHDFCGNARYNHWSVLTMISILCGHHSHNAELGNLPYLSIYINKWLGRILNRHIIHQYQAIVLNPMMMSSTGNFFRVTGHLCGNSPIPGEFPTQRPVTRSFDVFFGWANHRGAGDFRRHHAHYDVIVMYMYMACWNWQNFFQGLR